MDYILGCDIGTTSVKTIAFTLQGKAIRSHSISYPMSHPKPSWSEQNPDQMVQSTIQTISTVIDGTEGTPLGITFSAAMHGLLALDADNRPLTSLIIWADNRSTLESEELRSTTSGKEQYNRTGTPIHPMTPASKLRWLSKHQPAIFQNASCFLGIKEYLFLKLTGKKVMDYSLAGATGLFNLHTLNWDAETIQSIGIQTEQLPKVVSPYSQFYTNSIPELTKIPLIIGASDGCLANLGSGAVKNGTLAITIGTSGAIRGVNSSPILDPEMRTFCYPLNENLFVAGGPTNNGGIIFSWLKETFYKNESFDEMIDEAANIVEGANGLTFIPYLLGERAPIWDGNAKGKFVGIDITHTRAHFAKAVFEGVLMNIAVISKTISTSEPIHTIYANGGFAQSSYLVQLLANIMGIQIALNSGLETGCSGAAMMGLKSLGIWADYSNTHHFVKIEQLVTPNLTSKALYEPIIQEFEKLIHQ